MDRVKIGVIGSGAIAQVHHLPILNDLSEEFEIKVVCDLSPSSSKHAAERFHVPAYETDYRAVLDSDVDAVLLCHTDPKTEVALAAFNAGKHVFIEKPICFSLEQSDAMIEAQSRAGKVGQTGYMKLFEPAFEAARQEVESMDDIRYVQVNHLHPNNDLHVNQFRVQKFDDIPAEAKEKTAAARKAAIFDALGNVSPEAVRVFGTISGSLIHDLYGLRVLFGRPTRIVNTEVWQDGKAITTTLEFADGIRCVVTWVDLPEIWDFYETLEVYGSRKRVIVSYASGFSRNQSSLTVHGIDADGTSYKKEPALSWESPFRRELRHFHDSIVNGAENRASLAAARDDISLIIDITKAYINQAPVDR
jgi:predicted dehydrogenase